jgi:hypothetical protein
VDLLLPSEIMSALHLVIERHRMTLMKTAHDMRGVLVVRIWMCVDQVTPRGGRHHLMINLLLVEPQDLLVGEEVNLHTGVSQRTGTAMGLDPILSAQIPKPIECVRVDAGLPRLPGTGEADILLEETKAL